RHADPDHHRDARIRLRDAVGIEPELPRSRHPAAGLHLGRHGRAGPELPQHRLVGRLLARRRDHAHGDVAQSLRELAADRRRSGAALAAGIQKEDLMTGNDRHLVEVRNLSVEFHTQDGTVQAVRNVSWHIDRGETLAILGESGSGKSVSSSALMGLIDIPPGRIASGEVLYRGEDLLKTSYERQRELNGSKIAMI